MNDLFKIPNIVTTTRILFAIGLFLVKPLSYGFYILFLLCGLSDVLDGLLARKLNQTTKFGQVFDSIADFVWILSSLIILIRHFGISNYIIYGFLFIALIRLTTIIIGAIKFKQFCSIHSVSNKLTGFALFLLPFLVIAVDFSLLSDIIIILAFVASTEELFIVILSNQINRDTKSILSAIKRISKL